ncbi:hypothetical protein [Streptomyces sp. NPDC093097]|uniref:hypothetical protein n=1 Tax=Streptomyces sp. NPDC093097 TaxID=3366027 RepID=UPI003814A60F
MNVVPHRRLHSAGLGARLEQVVRSEFRRDEFVFAADDPVFGADVCRVAECRRRATGHGLCTGHNLRWRHEGRPDLDIFVATTDPRWKRQRPNLECRFPDCHYGTARGGLCQLHGGRWDRAGRPELESWMAQLQDFPRPAAGVSCLIEHCRLWPTTHSPFCRTHANTWKANGRPDAHAFAASFADVGTPGDQIVRLAMLGDAMRLEMQYVLQCRADERRSKTPPAVVMRVVRFLVAVGETSILQASEESWRDRYTQVAPRDANARALLAYAHRTLDDLVVGTGWETEFERDQWRLRRLGLTESNRTLSFEQIPQPQLRLLAKRWARWRLTSGLSYEAVRRAVTAVTRFACFLEKNAGVIVLAQLDRGVLERYLADLHAEYGGNAQRQGMHIGLLNRFFQAVRQHQWDTSLPSGVVFFSEDYPKRTERLPRALAEHVMAQVEHPDNLARFDSDAYRLVTVILIRCGLRVSDALKLAMDAQVWRQRETAKIPLRRVDGGASFLQCPEPWQFGVATPTAWSGCTSDPAVVGRLRFSRSEVAGPRTSLLVRRVPLRGPMRCRRLRLRRTPCRLCRCSRSATTESSRSTSWCSQLTSRSIICGCWSARSSSQPPEAIMQKPHQRWGFPVFTTDVGQP